VVWLSDVDKNDIPVVGGKAANLGELMRIEIPVPDGFVVDARTFRDFIQQSKPEREDLSQAQKLEC
jgi:pyruvate,water dikinase